MGRKIIKFLICITTLTLLWLYFFHEYSQKIHIGVSANYTRPINILKKLVIEKNDIEGYDQLRYAYFDEQCSEEYLFYSLLMANKRHYPQAYFDVYFSLIRRTLEQRGVTLDKETIAFMLNYLEKGAKLGHPQSRYELGQLYIEGKYVLKDTLLGKKMINSSGF